MRVLVVEDEVRLADNLAAALRELIAEPARIPAMGRLANQAAMPDAAAKIAGVCFEIADSERRAA